MKTRVLLWISAVIILSAFKIIQSWTADSQKCSVEFWVTGPFGAVNGSFSGLKSNIVFDEKNLEGSSITASVEVNTIETGNNLRNKDLRLKKEWFNAAHYPQIVIQSRQIQKTGNGYKLIGNLTIKGITKPVEIPFRFTPANNGGLFLSNFQINRDDFGIGKSGGGVAQDVTVKLVVPVTK